TTRPDDLVVDPYLGVGTTACAAVLHGRRAAGAELVADYVAIARERIMLAATGRLQTRPRHRPVHQPSPGSALSRRDDSPLPHRHRAGRRPPAAGVRLARQALAPPEPTQG